VHDCGRHAPQERALERAEASSSDDDHVDPSFACEFDDLLRDVPFDGHDVANNPVFLDAGHRARECRSGPAELLGERPLVVRVADTGDGAGRTLTNVTPARSDSASSRPSSIATRLPDDPSVAMRMRFSSFMSNLYAQHPIFRALRHPRVG